LIRRWIRFVSWDGSKWTPGYHSSIARPTFSLLREAKNLRSFVVEHSNICPTTRFRQHRTTPELSVSDCKPLLKELYKAQEGRNTAVPIAKTIQIQGEREGSTKCWSCDHSQQCSTNNLCDINCAGVAGHCDRVAADLRALVAKAVGIEG